MFSITLVNIDSYQAPPIPELDMTFSEFRGSEIRKVPIIRIFGSTVTGKKTCLHIHGIFPYMYVPCTIQENTDSYAYQLAASIDSALNTSFGSTLSTNQHVYKIQRVSGIPFYGYHEKEHLFFKIYFYNPAIIKRTADLLQNGAILNQTFQAYEAHIPYILQFMIDYNLYGMNLINLNNIKYRCSLQGCTTEEDSQNKSSMDLINSQMYLPTSVTRQSMCELEVDAHASDILNRQNITEKLELNPGLAAIWDEEKARRAVAGLENAKSQLLYPKTPSKIILPPTSNDIYQKSQLLKRLNAISQTDETIISNTTISSYPIEVTDNENVLNASRIINHSESIVCEENIERTLSDKFLQIASSAFLEANRSQSNVTDTSILDADDIQLVEMLANLAEENEIKSNVDDDSVLGSQYSISSEPVKNDPEEEEIEDLNITSLDLDDLSSWESMHKESNQHDNKAEVINNKQNTESDDLNVTEESYIDVTLTNFPQLDGIDDLCGNMLDYERETASDLKNTERRIVHNKKIEKELCVTRYQLQSDHRDLDVYDIDEIGTFGCLEHINQYYIADYEKDKCNYKRDSKSYIQQNIFLNINHKPSNFSTKFIISNIDGATATDSSDSEADVTIDGQEKCTCVYKSGKKNAPQNMVQITPKKRKLDFKDDQESPSKRRNMAVKTPKRKYNSPSKVSRSPQLSGNYSPLDITITSPKTSRSPVQQCNSPQRKQYISISDVPSTSTTPKRKTRSLRVNLLCEKGLTNLSNLDLEKNDTDNVQEKLVVNETDIVENTDYASTVKITKITTVHESIKGHEQRMENNENLLVKKTKEIRKRLSFLNYDEMENTLVESDRHASQSKNLIAFEHPIDQVRADAITISFNNENSDNSVPNSQQTEKSNNDTSPERNYASGIHNLEKKNLMIFHDIIPETDLEDEDDVCNTTFTQHVNDKIENDSQCSLGRNIHRSRRNALITITTKYKPPSTERILESMTLYGIPKCRWQKPFFGNKVDFAKQKESSNTNTLRFDVPTFKSSLEEITSIKLWRRMKVNEFYPSGASIKTHHIKRTLAGYNLLTIKPLMAPPSSKDIKNWIRAKRYLLEKNRDVKSCNRNKEKELNVQNAQHSSINIVNERDELQQGTSNNSISNNSSVEESDSLMLQRSVISRTSDETRKFEFTQNSDNLQISGDSLNPSLKKALENPLLHKQSKMQQQLGVSYGQIECSSKGSYGNVSNENLQNARAITAHQYLTLLSLEVHTVTREDLLPDPQYDSIAALFYAIYNDVSMDTNEQIEHGAIIVNSNSISARLSKIHSASVMCPILYVATEQDMFNSLIKLIEQYNPDILLGWEVEALSWGYVFQRAVYLGLNNFPVRISKVPHMQIFSKSDAHASEKDDASEIKVLGRNILDVWRIMRHEAGRTCEHARLFGIQFYEVFSRGSQFRVESMMLRLAKPMNYIPISPSIHQRAKMRAPECLPLIMEPESEFYTDPLIVLDFQSLYPSMIIAYNYCFSTCLGRIEHIGQYGPFEFGAATLRIRKNTALKLQDKINFSPCGVAFVKKEVRQGILPRMLAEILNTRLMVKESMKLHPAENRALHRVLHSQQLGLKLIANVTYGYTSANFSGRMPCIEIGDSVVSKGRETLERAIKLVESTPKWGARVVYGDTDSIFVLLPGKSREEAFTIGEEIADAVTAINPPPVKLKFEKVLHPCILQTKKRYCGYMYETRDQEKPEFLAKGIETVRRDGCPAVSKILEKALKILFDTKDISLVKLYVVRQFDKIFQRRASIQDLTFAKEFRGMRGYKANACVPALELTRRLIRKDPRAVPRTSERVRYIIVAGAPNQPLIHCVRTPMEVITDPALIPNSVYYITKVIIPPLNRCFNLFGIDVNTWYKEISHRTNFNNIARCLGEENSKSTIRQFFSSTICIACGEQTNKEVCPECLSQSSRTILVLLQKIRQLERNQQQIAAICHSCIGRLGDIECLSLDCPILYRMAQARKELRQVSYINNIIYGNNSSGIKGLDAVAEWY
ncbi:dna polymerase zeta catalytic subunit-like protein [Lasius niger]|uniref:DNA polymerase zeta catalytic subunit n=1 Tax=Lasius niger TaxID=67767 RepID=A0A0J7KVK1_LASNI|nr:dna polymerase zeta catalytic subunit-like protein [Lasius niger]